MMIPSTRYKMTSPCDFYTIPRIIWPKKQFPSEHPAVSRIGQRERIAIKDAWNFFEQVEAIDASTRVRLGNTGGQINRQTHLWYSFRGDGERMLYEKGRRYHILICPSLDWTPQRNLPIPTIPLTDVTPADCPCYNPDGCGETPLLRSIPLTTQPGSRSIQEKTPPSQKTSRSVALVKEGIPTKVTEDHQRIMIVENTPSTPRSAATPTSTGSPRETGSPHPPGSPAGTDTPKSEKEDPPTLVITDVSPRINTPTELPADRIQLV